MLSSLIRPPTLMSRTHLAIFCFPAAFPLTVSLQHLPRQQTWQVRASTRHRSEKPRVRAPDARTVFQPAFHAPFVLRSAMGNGRRGYPFWNKRICRPSSSYRCLTFNLLPHKHKEQADPNSIPLLSDPSDWLSDL